MASHCSHAGVGSRYRLGLHDVHLQLNHDAENPVRRGCCAHVQRHARGAAGPAGSPSRRCGYVISKDCLYYSFAYRIYNRAPDNLCAADNLPIERHQIGPGWVVRNRCQHVEHFALVQSPRATRCRPSPSPDSFAHAHFEAHAGWGRSNADGRLLEARVAGCQSTR